MNKADHSIVQAVHNRVGYPLRARYTMHRRTSQLAHSGTKRPRRPQTPFSYRNPFLRRRWYLSQSKLRAKNVLDRYYTAQVMSHWFPFRRIKLNRDRPYGFPVPYKKLFNTFESIVAKYSGRPHWAKAHSLGPKDLAVLYPKYLDFVHVLQTYDPEAVFRNEYVRRHIFGEDIGARIFKTRE